MVETKPLNIVAQVGKNIAARRKQLNLRQDQVAEAIGIEPESVSRFERAAHAPSLKTLEKLGIYEYANRTAKFLFCTRKFK